MHAVCDVCQGAPAALFCAADEAVLCRDCDEKIHSCNKLASRHVRVRLTESSPVGRCDFCESSPAFFYCCIDGSSLCLDCDIRVHVGAKQSHERYLILRQKLEYVGTKLAPSFQDPPLKQFECEKEIQNGMWWFQQMTDQTNNYEVPQIIMKDDVKNIYVDLEDQEEMRRLRGRVRFDIYERFENYNMFELASCSGLKDRSNIVPISQFDHNLLLSDYVFLEDTKRVADVARRVRGRVRLNYPYGNGNGNGNGNGRLPSNLHALRNAAYRRRMRLLILPNGMSRREQNRSRYDRRSDSIFWTIEWRFHSTKVVLIDHNVKECMSINYVIGKHLKPSLWNHPLKAFCNEDIENLKFFIPKSPKGSKTVFRELNPVIPFGQQLAGVGLLEYPVIYVHLPSETYNFEVEKDEKRLHVHEKPQEKRETTPTPKGIVFREEEMEDDSAPDTQVLDFMDYLNTTDREAFLSDMLTSKEAIQSAAGREELERATSANGSANATMVCNFNFEQGLKDAYSDLMREVNPDDFLCFDGLYSDNEETRGKDGCNGDLEEELEEGEIPNY